MVIDKCPLPQGSNSSEVIDKHMLSQASGEVMLGHGAQADLRMEEQVASQSVARAATVDLEQEANNENMLGVYTSSVCMPVYGDPSFSSAVNDVERELRHTHTSTRSDVLGSSVVAIFVR